MNKTLSKGWISTNIGSISTHPQYGWTCSAIKKGKIKLLRTTDISNGKINWDSVPFCSEEPENNEKFLLKEDDILVSRAGSVGISYKITKNDLFHPTVFASYLIRFRSFIPASFVAYFFKSHIYWEFISDSKLGIAIPNVNATKLASLPFPLPPLNEQKRIVERLDKIIPRIDAVKSRLEKIPSLIKRFRQSILNAAVTGKLTEKWREEKINLTFYSLIKCKRVLRDYSVELPDGWSLLSFTDVCEIKLNLVNPKDFLKQPHIAPDNIERGTGRLIGYNTIETDKVFSSKHRFYKGQIIYSKIRPYLSKAIYVEFNGLCSSDMYPLTSKINPHFLHYYILSSFFLNFASTAGERSVLPKINKTELSIIPVPVPSQEEQEEIVRQVDKYFALADTLEIHYKNAKEKVDKLTQSVLAKAFRGELVTPEAILAEKEGRNFESAEQLLERIINEKNSK